jgi:hypothetical protein
MQKKQPVSIFENLCCRASTTSDGVRCIQFQLHLFGVYILKYQVEVCWMLTDCVHVVVVAQRYTQVRGTLPDLRQQFAEPLAFVGRHHARIRFKLV